MQRSFDHNIVFQGAKVLTVQEVADSLIANEQILLHVGAVLESLFEGLTVEKVSIQFKSVNINSPLTELLLVTIHSNYQAKIGEMSQQLIKDITGMEVGEGQALIISILFLIVLCYGIDWAMKKFILPKADNKSAITVQGNYYNILLAGSQMTGLEPEKISAAVEAAIKPQQRDGLARKVLRFIRPAKSNPGASIEGAGVEISAATIAASPSEIDMGEEEQTQVPYQRCKIEIHATDKDRTKSGWAGHIPTIWEKRLNMQIYPTIDPKELFGKETIVGDIILVSRRNQAGEMQPYVFHLLQVYQDET